MMKKQSDGKTPRGPETICISVSYRVGGRGDFTYHQGFEYCLNVFADKAGHCPAKVVVFIDTSDARRDGMRQMHRDLGTSRTSPQSHNPYSDFDI